MHGSLNTSRGQYSFVAQSGLERIGNDITLTLSLSQQAGLERVSFRCFIGAELLSPAQTELDYILSRLQPWIERNFEQLRESALKSIRSERRLFDQHFSHSERGPF